MSRMRILTSVLALVLLSPVLSVAQPAPADSPEARAVSYLSKEVPKWHTTNGCYSCHNNGDGARALLMASHRGYDVGPSLETSLAFLRAPETWATTKVLIEANRPLGRVSYAAALATAGERDATPAKALVQAAGLIIGDQQADGSWSPYPAHTDATPVTYGPALATWLARSTLIAAGREPDDFAVAQTDRWLRTYEVVHTADAAGVLLAMNVTSDVMADKQRAISLSILRRAQTSDGGWGPSADATPTVFHSALAILALQQYVSDPRLARSTYRPEELRDALDRGRRWLASQQLPDGSWPETMREAGKKSYAQKISTTSWALMALLSK